MVNYNRQTIIEEREVGSGASVARLAAAYAMWPEATLHIESWGEELFIRYDRVETEGEYNTRISNELLMDVKNHTKEKAKRDKKLEQYNKLKKELGLS